MDVKDYESSRFHTVVFMDGEHSEDVNLQDQISVVNDALAEAIVKEEKASGCEEFVNEFEVKLARDDNQEISYECAPQEEWCPVVKNEVSDAITNGMEKGSSCVSQEEWGQVVAGDASNVGSGELEHVKCDREEEWGNGLKSNESKNVISDEMDTNTECTLQEEWNKDVNNDLSAAVINEIDQGMIKSNPQEQWCASVTNNTGSMGAGKVEYYEIPSSIDGQYYAVTNEAIKEEEDTPLQSSMESYQMASLINTNDDVIDQETDDSSNIQYFQVPQIIEKENNQVISGENIQPVNTEDNEEPTIIVHLGNNLTIDEKGQIHSSASEYFPVEGNEEECDASEGEFFIESADDGMMIDQQEIQEGEQFEDEPAPKGGEIFILSTMEELEMLLQEYCQRTNSQFVGSSKSKNFGSSSSECVLTGHQISWCDIQSKERGMDSIIKFDGVPYMIVGTNILHCQFGTNKSAADRERRKAKRAERGIDVTNHDLKYPTKKCGCPAKVNIKQIIRFPEFKIEKDTGWKRRDCAARLRLKLKNSRETVAMEMRFVGRLPDISEHKFHESLQDLVYTKELVMQDLVVKAQNLWLEGKSNLEIFDSIRNHVVNEMFWNREPPDLKMKRYYPTKKDIRNYITRVYHMCHLRDAQKESIKIIINEALLEELGANVSFDISEKSLNENNDMDSSDEELLKQDVTGEEQKTKKKEVDKKVETFLFCYQTPTQQRLMKKYNNLIYVVEIEPIRLTKRVLTYSMFALLVQTNIDYQVVGSLIISKHRKEGLQEGLVLFREWNAYWNPKYFLVDCCEVIYNAVTAVFPDAVYFLNPHSCENKWLEFMKTPSNDLEEHTDELIKHLKNMQYSLTEESLSVAALVFEQSQVWQNSEKFRTWFQTKWLPIAKYWVMGYRPEDLLTIQHVKTSIDCCINVYRDALYQSAKYDGFIDLLKSVTMVFPKDEYQKYVTRSNDAYWYYKQYSRKISNTNYMQGVPISIIPYVLDVCELAQKHEFNVNHDQMGVFNVEYNPSSVSAVDQNGFPVHSNSENPLSEDNSSSLLRNENNTTSLRYDETLGIYVLNDDKVNVESLPNMKEVNIRETVFGWIECSKAMEPGEHTVSFGDVTSYPFCTCSHWMLYRLPCVHMFVVFIKIPGWRYDMLSPLYRYSAVLHIDCSCIVNSQAHPGTDVACQSVNNNVSVATQTQNVDASIFESATNFKTPDLILGQAKEFFLVIKKNAFLFRNKMLHSQLCCQLDKLVSKLYAESAKNKPYQFCLDEIGLKNADVNDTRKPLKICSLNLQQIKKISDSAISIVSKSQGASKMADSTCSRTSSVSLNKNNNRKTSVKNAFLVKTVDNSSLHTATKGLVDYYKTNDLNPSVMSCSNLNTIISANLVNSLNRVSSKTVSTSSIRTIETLNHSQPVVNVKSISLDPVNGSRQVGFIGSSTSKPHRNISVPSNVTEVNLISSMTTTTTTSNRFRETSKTVTIDSGIVDKSLVSFNPIPKQVTVSSVPDGFVNVSSVEVGSVDVMTSSDSNNTHGSLSVLPVSCLYSNDTASGVTEPSPQDTQAVLITKTNLKRSEISTNSPQNFSKRKKDNPSDIIVQTIRDKIQPKSVSMTSSYYSSQNKGKYTLRRKLPNDSV